jgi:hypothetical protein
MTRWLHYNLEYPIALTVVLTMLPMTLINFSAQQSAGRDCRLPMSLGGKSTLGVVASWPMHRGSSCQAGLILVSRRVPVKTVSAQPVDATLSNQLIHKCLP